MHTMLKCGYIALLRTSVYIPLGHTYDWNNFCRVLKRKNFNRVFSSIFVATPEFQKKNSLN